MSEKREITVIGYVPKDETLEKTMSLCTCIQDWTEVGVFEALKNALFRAEKDAIKSCGVDGYNRVKLSFTFEISKL